MKNQKENVITVRFRATEEKYEMEKAAEEYAMSLNQYAKYKILAGLENIDSNNSNSIETQSSHKHWRLLSRIIIYSYLHIQRLAENQLSDDELQQINAEAIERLEKLGLRETQ